MTKPCNIPGCRNISRSRGMCNKHYIRWKKYSNPLHVHTGDNCSNKSVYVLIAEKALGRQLSLGNQVHHVDSDRSNNSNSNLVVCPDQSYHTLIHRRTEAYDACGNANYKKCVFCKKYDAPENLRRYGNDSYEHIQCRREYQNNRYHNVTKIFQDKNS
jgi:hypothetical protein